MVALCSGWWTLEATLRNWTQNLDKAQVTSHQEVPRAVRMEQCRNTRSWGVGGYLSAGVLLGFPLGQCHVVLCDWSF